MRVFLDQDVPHGIRRYLKERHEVVTAIFQGWDRIENGATGSRGKFAFIEMPIQPKRPYVRSEE